MADIHRYNPGVCWRRVFLYKHDRKKVKISTYKLLLIFLKAGKRVSVSAY